MEVLKIYQSVSYMVTSKKVSKLLIIKDFRSFLFLGVANRGGSLIIFIN